MLDRFSQPIAFATAPLVSGSSKLKGIMHPESVDPDTGSHDGSSDYWFRSGTHTNWT